MAFIVSLFFGFFPMFVFAAIVYWLDRYEKEPKALLGAAFFLGHGNRRRRSLHS